MPLEKLDKYARLAPAGPLSPQQAAREVLDAVAEARAESIARLLIDLRAMALEPRPSVTDRYDLGYDMARIGGGIGRIAFVMSSCGVDLYEFAFLVASNRGPHAEGFTDEGEALAWLLAPSAGHATQRV